MLSLPALVLALLPTPTGVPAGGPGVASGRAPVQEGGTEEAPQAPPGEARFSLEAKARYAATTRAERIARDGRITFSAAAADRARAVLELGATGLQRTAALMALGCGGSPADATRLEAAAAEGEIEERRAATLALGELGSAGIAALYRLASRGERGLAVHGCIALIRTRTAEGRELVEELARDFEAGFQEGAYLCVPYARGGPPPDPSPAFDLLLDLRWEAARRFGFVDGQRWQAILRERLIEDADFLDRFIDAASADPSSQSLRDHFHEIVLEGGSPTRLRVPAAIMAADLEAMIASGEWRPDGMPEWREMMDAIRDRHAERQAVDLCLRMHAIPELRDEAGLAVLRGGGEPDVGWLKNMLSDGQPKRHAQLMEALGESGDKARIDALILFLTRPRPVAVRAAALVALFRLGHEPSRDELRTIVDGPANDMREECIRAATRVGHDARLLSTLLGAVVLPDLSPDVRFHVELTLGEEGRLRTRDGLREWLSRGISSPTRRRVVGVLADGADERDLAMIRDMFPVEDDMALNVDLALALLRYRDPVVMRMLRAALWGSGFHRSVMAARLFFQASGLHALISELDSIPRRATETHVRRLGFAIGEWGGLSAVETLARRRGPEDPALQGAYLGALSTRSQ